ncbi:DNA-3-methyladenine glycosylase [Nocardia camponoti]|uniref:Putative 3-methyladenine DNA glycosylase n=1 Tax=Nocardia camponoti TaxID=1616106 RepID=A0A917VEQ2_9NOCA|nr:DNA-3-methyladenine glycosylase [Nocardia camponoti]GGK67024.1 putative 3-methyladenine DNA glycosylase [Nocardia camponoti]
MTAEELMVDPPTAARRLLGSVVWSGPVGMRVVEVEAYGGDPTGPWPDPAAHSWPGPTARNAAMFGPAGRLYLYRSYGIHVCANVTCGYDGAASGVLMRAGEIIAGHEEARARRPAARSDVDLARGPGNVGSALGFTFDDYGTELFDPFSPIRVDLREPIPAEQIAEGPRVGVSSAADVPWRFWLPDSPSVSAYRRSPRADSVKNSSRGR